jgi:hypothetical protein
VAEVLLLAASAALPLVGLGLRRTLHKAELAVLFGTLLGTALAASAWVTRGFWHLTAS